MKGFLIYKCRLCNSEHKPTSVPDVMKALISAVCHTSVPKEWNNYEHKIPLLELHSCSNGRLGVSDLVGGEET